MSDENVIEFLGDHIHVIGRGNVGFAASLRLWKRIVAACEEHDCYKILGEARTEETMSTIDGYKHIDIFREAGVTWKHQVAWVAEDEAKYKELKFVETVLRNRGLGHGHLFRNVDDARRWLLGEEPAQPTQDQASQSK
ncbi:MAG: hypothetical protein ACIALR_10340 [Blastopirellula sp. JB062]